MEAILGYPGHATLLPDIVRAENCTLHAADGRRIVDLEAGVWCLCLGHGHPRVLQALSEQAALIAHAGYAYSHPVVAAAADDLLARLGLAGGRCVLLASGSEAVEYGVRTAQLLAERPLLLTMSDSYFGAYGSASRRQPDEWVVYDWLARGDCGHGEDCLARCAHWAALPFERIGGLLLEPGSSSGLVRFPPRALVRRLAARIQGEGGLLLVNEVTTGLGRTGRWFGFQHYDLAPDIVALGKGLGNGYPVSATALAPRVAQRLGDRLPRYAQSHQNDPLGAAVLRAVIRALAEEGLSERSRELGEWFLAELLAIAEREPRLAAVRGRGLMLALELEDAPGAPFTAALQRALLEAGYLVAQRPGLKVLRVDPSLTVPREALAGFLTALPVALGRAAG
ncbi:aminotransferase class III-fold pyridoxal phosphate-dependent enzyme [bacterium]|nr:aminotransferase class III-fold pyridoxal phosphate-dependent enzyme [bacterium]